MTTSMRDRVAELAARRAKAREMGGAEKIAKQHDRGKLTALSNGAFCAGIAISGALFGPIAEHSGFPQVYLVAGLATWGAVTMLATGRV